MFIDLYYVRHVFVSFCLFMVTYFCFLNFCMQPPKASDRAQVQSKEVRLPDSGPIPLDDQDVQIVSSYAFTITLF